MLASSELDKSPYLLAVLLAGRAFDKEQSRLVDDLEFPVEWEEGDGDDRLAQSGRISFWHRSLGDRRLPLCSSF